MTKRKKLAAVVLVLTGMTLLSHGVDAVEREHRPYETVSRVVQPGQSLWDICSKLSRTSGPSSTGAGWTTTWTIPEHCSRGRSS